MAYSSFGFIGGGRITWLLLKALATRGKLPANVTISDPDEKVLTKVQAIAPNCFQTVTDNKLAARAQIVFLSVHPPIVKDVLAEIKNELQPKSILISLAPVVSIEKMSTMLGGFKRIIRMIPNAPSLIHQGYNPVVFTNGFPSNERADLNKLFHAWGEAPIVKEDKLEAYAIITAMGPTYFWPQWVKLQELGKTFGLSDDELIAGIPDMLKGAVNLMYDTDRPATEVMDLIPAYPIKDDETTIQDIFQTKLTALYNKLTGK
ncbi:NAD(P)-binding domain-containing protein [candidate division KSB1 bacterium]|nr:NAD(P)-binding domain-containing protein [candidate division KSB1 bacterium]